MRSYNKVFKAALKNKRFLKEIERTNEISTPAMPFDAIDRSIFAGYYLGWLIGKYGTCLAMEKYRDIIK